VIFNNMQDNNNNQRHQQQQPYYYNNFACYPSACYLSSYTPRYDYCAPPPYCGVRSYCNGI
jgi:hypothetical protein